MTRTPLALPNQNTFQMRYLAWRGLGILSVLAVTTIRDNMDVRPTTPWSNLLNNDFWGTPTQRSLCTPVPQKSTDRCSFQRSVTSYERSWYL
ncbi:hypothetical protein CEXT_423201 [Caerostris extrusa]|uniref:Uncharacterized protein n=1 Tax=Caerostris extrusa TaxID=172846 RepID=A0AAV4R6S4_CAEEX|nr:hypothetical protein CEXT_423201 [Caerostris extrusa]